MNTGVVVNLIALGGVIAYLLRHAYPATEAVRLRNALLLAPSRPDDFNWTPENVPQDFRLERRPASPEIAAVVRSIGVDRLDGEWERALALAAHLTAGAEDKGPIRSDLVTTYRRIRAGEGYCADFVRVFLALAHTAGLTARQWDFSFNGFGGHGHTFVEVFDRRRAKWLFLDVYNNFHVVDASTGEPLSAFELRDALEGRRPPMRLEANGPGRPGFRYAEKALDYYRRGLDEWYLLWGNAVLSDDANPLPRWASRVSVGLGRVASMLLDTQPRIRILRTADNPARIEALARLRRHARFAIVLLLALAGVLLVQVSRPAAPV